MAETLIDARGMRCPWPALRLARAMRDAGPGAEIRMVADDPKADGEISQLAVARGWRLERLGGEEGLIFLLNR